MNAIQYHLINDSRERHFDNCYETGNYEDYDCESCPHKSDCSGYKEDDD